MEGNSNEAMATAIESSKVIAVFLSKSYQESVNCIIEFKYAISLNKPIIFILMHEFPIDPWIQSQIDANYQFSINSIDDMATMYNNLSKLDWLAQVIRVVGAAQPDRNDDYDLSEEVFNLKQVLNDALDEIAANTGKARFKTCTRCQKQYEENNPIGCKAHSAYYMGGTIIAGRWVCCKQQDKDSVGCSDAVHTDFKLKWTVDPAYGTYKWM
jgi:hypothetical protein